VIRLFSTVKHLYYHNYIFHKIHNDKCIMAVENFCNNIQTDTKSRNVEQSVILTHPNTLILNEYVDFSTIIFIA
jgi:hypothetical protein